MASQEAPEEAGVVETAAEAGTEVRGPADHRDPTEGYSWDLEGVKKEGYNRAGHVRLRSRLPVPSL